MICIFYQFMLIYVKEEKMKSISKDPLVKQLSICGQVAEHKSEMIQTHGDGNEDKILSVLNDEEKETLEQILNKLQQAWLNDHKEHHNKK